MAVDFYAADLQRRIEVRRRQRAEFAERVLSEETRAKKNPRVSERRVIGLIALAYAYISVILAIAVACAGFLVYAVFEVGAGDRGMIKLALLIGLFVVAVVQSLWVKFERLDGVVVSRKQAPALYAMVNEISDAVRAPRPHEIRIGLRANAAACQRPILRVFGPYRNSLLIGLPLLMGLEADQLRAAIAHELGHFSRAHGKLAAWVYRVSETWKQMRERFSARRAFGGWLFARFASWFEPKFAAATFAMRRLNESEADRLASGVAGAENLAESLLRISCLDAQLEEVMWAELDRERRNSPMPPNGFLLRMNQAAAVLSPTPTLCRQLERALTQPTDCRDTHPSLTERLRALGQLPASTAVAVELVCRPLSESAGRAVLGDSLMALIDLVERHFVEGARGKWLGMYFEFQDERVRLDELRDMDRNGELDDSERVDLAYLTYRVEGAEAAEPLFRELHSIYPDNAVVSYWLGEILALRGDQEAERLLEQAMTDNFQLMEPALSALAKLYWVRAEYLKLARLEQTADDAIQTRRVIEDFAKRLSLSDEFEPHDLEPDAVAELTEALRPVPKLHSAYLVRKVLPTGERRLALIAFHRKRNIERNGEEEHLQRELICLDEVPQGTMIFSPADRKRWIAKLESTPQAKIFG